MQDNEKKPALRFKGFTDPWEQRKLSELTSMHARIGWQNLRTSEFLDSGDYMLITGTDFDDGTVNYSTCHFVERERYEQDKNIQIRNGSILITKDGTLGKVAYVQSLSMPATLNAGVFNVEIRNTSIVDERYLFQYLKAPFLMDYVDKKATGGTIKHLNQNILVDFPVVMPKKTEQVSIGNFFQRIDTLITLHQRKYEKLVNIKKSMLDKMFPKNGASVPEIRFKGFTDPWEQRKVGTLIEDYTEKTVTQNQYPVLTSSQQQGIVLQEDYFADRQVTTDNNVGYYVLPKGYFTYRSRSDTDVFVFNRNNIVDKGIISYYYPVFAPKSCDSNFLLRRLNHGIKKQLSMAAEGTGQKVLAHAKFKNMVVDVPSQSEQEKIGTILEELDTLITLHQRKLEKLQNIKKSCLEKMFV